MPWLSVTDIARAALWRLVTHIDRPGWQARAGRDPTHAEILRLWAAVAMIAMAIASVASAGSNKANGTTVTGTAHTPIAWGGVALRLRPTVEGGNDDDENATWK